MEERFKTTKKAGFFGIIGNMILLIIKGFIGLISGSQAMIADSINSASDIFASLMTFIGNKIASEPKDKDHNFGHGKAEYIFSLLISLAMILLSVKLLIDSISSLITHSKFNFSWGLIIVCVITICTKFALYIYTKSAAKKHNNILLEANYKDHRNDCLVTTGTLVACLGALFNAYWLDGVIGTAIAIWILYTGIKIFIESYNILMDISLDSTTNDIIMEITKTYKEIKGVESIYSTPSGYKYVVFVTIAVDGNLTTFDSHKIADNLESDLKKLDKISDAIVHVNPV